MTKISWVLFFAFLSSVAQAESLNMKVTGDTKEKVDLETLSPSPDIPNADALSFSLDDGKGAIEAELSPLSISNAARLTTPSQLPPPGFSLIPSSPYILQPAPPKELVKSNWEFLIVDEQNKTWHRQTGEGETPQEFVWDGTENDDFILDPNRTYYSTFVSSTTTYPGEATRFIALSRQYPKGTVILFGDRVYIKDEAAFSPEGKFYLKDLIRRMSRHTTAWSMTLTEPERDEHPDLAKERVALWKSFLEKELDGEFINERFILKKAEGTEATAEIRLQGAQIPTSESLMHGQSFYEGPHTESIESLIRVKEVKGVTVIEMRHDRLFRPGSAYVRDEALSHLLKTLNELPHDKRILLRSYTKKIRDVSKQQQEDPKLAAMRSKILFSIFAEAGFLKKSDPSVK